MITAAQRSENARIAALSRWARENPAANAQRGQEGLRARFERQVDNAARIAGESLTDRERARRVENLRLLHMQRMTAASRAARAARKASAA